MTASRVDWQGGTGGGTPTPPPTTYAPRGIERKNAIKPWQGARSRQVGTRTGLPTTTPGGFRFSSKTSARGWNGCDFSLAVNGLRGCPVPSRVPR
jgi:hypothetical protein